MTTDQPYLNRAMAGRILAAEIQRNLPQAEDTVVVGLPRGGVPVAEQVAAALKAPLDVFMVRKLGLPDRPEFAMGAIASGDIKLLDQELIDSARVSPAELAAVIARETQELERREKSYRAGHQPLPLVGRSVIIVDDGIATGLTIRAAVLALREVGCREIRVAAPVGAPSICQILAAQVEAVYCPLQPEPFHAVGLWYLDFSPTTDAEVRDCLARMSGPASNEATPLDP